MGGVLSAICVGGVSYNDFIQWLKRRDREQRDRQTCMKVWHMVRGVLNLAIKDLKSFAWLITEGYSIIETKGLSQFQDLNFSDQDISCTEFLFFSMWKKYFQCFSPWELEIGNFVFLLFGKI